MVNSMNILIIKLGAIGDVLRMTSILMPLKEKYPNAHITWVTKKNSVELLETNKLIDEIVLIGDALKGKLKKKEFDLTISFDDEEEACSLASLVKSKKLVGAFMEEGKPSYTKDSTAWFDMGLISTYGKVEADKKKAENDRTYQDIHFSILSLKNPKSHPPILVLDESDKRFTEMFAQKHGILMNDKVIGLNTGAGGRWQDKKLSVEQTIELIERISKQTKAKLILFGGPDEESRNRDIIKGSKIPLIDAGCQNPLRKFAALVGLCDVVVTSDSLAMHIAIALGKKVVAFFYPTSAAEIELYGKGEKIIAQGKSYCSYQAVCTHPPKWDIDGIANAALSLL